MSSEFASIFAKMREKRREDKEKETVSDKFGDVDVSSPGKIRKFGSALLMSPHSVHAIFCEGGNGNP